MLDEKFQIDSVSSFSYVNWSAENNSTESDDEQERSIPTWLGKM